MNNLQGKVLGNRYVLLDKIGDGGMAIVYKARCQLLNRFVAVKILRHEYTADEEFIKKFKRESLAAASLSHPNIVGIYDVGEQDGIYYIVMEYVKGETLKEYIKKHIKINYEDTLKIVYQIALALEHAHKNGVVHRDIKPHNILITEDKIVKVTDFGIARASTSSTMTNTGRVMGSVHYLSPEQARGTFSDHRTDIYSLGVVMYELLTGKLPYDAESPISVALKHIQENFITPSELDASIPRAVNDIVVKAMEKDMGKRYQSVRELVNDIFLAQSNPNMGLRKGAEQDEQSTRVIPVEEIEEAIVSSPKRKKEEKKKRNIWPIILVSILIFSAITGAMAYGYKRFFQVKDVAVPNIVGLTEDDAKRKLEDLKLIMEVENRVSSEEPEGKVLKVYPDVGVNVKENSVVKVTLSAGPKKVKVPNLKNMDTASAEAALKRASLKLGSVEKKNSDEVEKDLIISQSEAPNSEVLAGSEINIVISEGPKLEFVVVPQLYGKTLDEAKAKLKAAKLVLGEVKYGESSKYIDNVVIDQDVAPGIQVKEGSVINITINKLTEDEGSDKPPTTEGGVKPPKQ